MAQKKLKTSMKYCLWLLFLIIFFFFKTNTSFAQSNYVLPYPPPMPGNFLYKIRLVSEQIQRYWYFGNFGQFSFSLKQSDKYLVQAKTLFEYKQYLLGDEALKKSDMHFKKAPKYLSYAKKENKNIDRQQKILKDAALKHIEILNEIKIYAPKEIIWNPEKSLPTKIFLSSKLTEAIHIRQSCL
jgi:hypothetical protein